MIIHNKDDIEFITDSRVYWDTLYDIELLLHYMKIQHEEFFIALLYFNKGVQDYGQILKDLLRFLGGFKKKSVKDFNQILERILK